MCQFHRYHKSRFLGKDNISGQNKIIQVNFLSVQFCREFFSELGIFFFFDVAKVLSDML